MPIELPAEETEIVVRYRKMTEPMRGIVMYQRSTDCAWFSGSESNRDYQEMLAWKAAGGVIEDYAITEHDDDWNASCGF